MAKYKTYSVFVNLGIGDDDKEIPIIHKYVETVNKENAIRLALCSLSVSVLKGTEVKVTASLLSNWQIRKVQCQ